MDSHELRSKRKIGMALLEEVVADILNEAESEGEMRGLHAREVRNRTGFPLESHYIELCECVLKQMENDGDAIMVSPPSPGNPARYRPAQENAVGNGQRQ